MNGKGLGRRGTLSGGLAAAVVMAHRTAAMAAPDVDADVGRDRSMAAVALAPADRDAVAEADACHGPFRAAFLAWLRAAPGRFILPALASAMSPSCTELRVRGVHPAISIVLMDEWDIGVGVEWEGVFWDMLLSLDLDAQPASDGAGWVNHDLDREFQAVHTTREALWRADGFEWLLDWVNQDLARATHLALWCSDGGGCTWAHLVRDGAILRTGQPVAAERMPAHLLPVHGHPA